MINESIESEGGINSKVIFSFTACSEYKYDNIIVLFDVHY